jgi:hypothetical protein
MIRDEIRQFLKKEKMLFVEEVHAAAGHLNMKPLQRTVVGCLKALGDRFEKVTKDELVIAVLVVQITCAHSKKKSMPSGND